MNRSLDFAHLRRTPLGMTHLVLYNTQGSHFNNIRKSTTQPSFSASRRIRRAGTSTPQQLNTSTTQQQKKAPIQGQELFLFCFSACLLICFLAYFINAIFCTCTALLTVMRTIYMPVERFVPSTRMSCEPAVSVPLCRSRMRRP